MHNRDFGRRMSERALVLCADDYAVHEEASRGIAELAQAGRLSATSVMVLSPRWATDAALLQPLRGRIDVGLHLDWTSEFALAAGHGLSLRAAMWRSVTGGFDHARARQVIADQLNAFETVWHAPPDHIDGHQHVQQFAGIREALVELVQEAVAQRWQGAKPYLRLSSAPRGQRDVKGRIIAALGAPQLEGLARRAALPMAGALSGIYDFAGDITRYDGLMRHWLQTTPGHGIIMCHPARSQVAGDPIGAARAREYRYLASPDFARALDEAGVCVERFCAAVPWPSPRGSELGAG